MNLSEAALARIPRPDGFVSAHLVETATGQVLATVVSGDPGDPDAAGETPSTERFLAAVTESLHRLAAATVLDGVDNDVEDVMLTTRTHHYLVRKLRGLAGSDTLLVLVLDRVRANLALARHLLVSYEAALVA